MTEYKLKYIQGCCGGGGGVVGKHNDLSGRDEADCHPITAITGLESRLTSIVNTLQSRINNESEMRENADTAMSNRISTEVSRLDGAIGAKADKSTVMPMITALSEAVDGKQNQITIGIPAETVDGDFWIEPTVAIPDVSLNYATVGSLTILSQALTAERNTRANEDVRIREDYQSADASVLNQARQYADSVVGSIYKVKGSTTNNNLFALTPNVGDVWNITDDGVFPAGSNVVWDGARWDKLSETVDMTPFNDHIANLSNPHHVTYQQIGLTAVQMDAIDSGVTEIKVAGYDEGMTKLGTIQPNAEQNVIDTITMAGFPLTPLNRTVDIGEMIKFGGQTAGNALIWFEYV